MPRLLLALAFLAGSLAAATPPATAGDGSWVWPVEGVAGGSPTLETEFDPPDSDYGPGHRGIDLATLVGAPVRAVAPGVVSFAGRVAGVGVVTVDHGAERSTYQPVSAAVSVGDHVDAGDVLGEVVLGPFHCSSPCLHLGRIASPDDWGHLPLAGDYLDPLDRLPGHSRIRLVDPAGPPPVPPVGPVGSGVLQRPLAGPVTSPFGTREHPTSGDESFHDGVDFGAACGTPVRTAAPGTVVAVGRSKALGLRVAVRHGHGLKTSYGHLSDALVDVGDDVDASTVIGKVGSTGLSTGCHLHFGVLQTDKSADPLTFL
ncbi:MAG TPA: peptidoglycan DD-metalloendopeptidase family protein [Aeromicrobium sp.]|nr:peptidoglycan DD-metalloendopeptidase family protein [Aeromicrobium sp.]